jgi:hypothetical protein
MSDLTAPPLSLYNIYDGENLFEGLVMIIRSFVQYYVFSTK